MAAAHSQSSSSASSGDEPSLLGRLLGKGADSSEPKCMDCKNDAAAFMCLPCAQLQCATCAAKHKLPNQFAAVRNHPVKKLATKASLRLAAMALEQSKICPEHDDAFVYWSEASKTAVCATCQAKEQGSPMLIRGTVEKERMLVGSALETNRATLQASEARRCILFKNAERGRANLEKLKELAKAVHKLETETEQYVIHASDGVKDAAADKELLDNIRDLLEAVSDKSVTVNDVTAIQAAQVLVPYAQGVSDRRRRSRSGSQLQTPPPSLAKLFELVESLKLSRSPNDAPDRGTLPVLRISDIATERPFVANGTVATTPNRSGHLTSPLGVNGIACGNQNASTSAAPNALSAGSAENGRRELHLDESGDEDDSEATGGFSMTKGSSQKRAAPERNAAKRRK